MLKFRDTFWPVCKLVGRRMEPPTQTAIYGEYAVFKRTLRTTGDIDNAEQEYKISGTTSNNFFK